MAQIASDLDNKEFVGATNPDARLAVMFYKKAVKNEFESQKEGRPIFMDMDYVKISVPGDNTTEIDQPVREDHKKRFPLHWAHYQNMTQGDAKEIGTPLSQWPRLTISQVEELRALKFYTVESVANASDANIQRIQMIAGMSPYAFREHAQRFLKIADSDAITAEAEEKARAAEERAAALEARLAEMEEKLLAKAEPKPRGRKPKQEQE